MKERDQLRAKRIDEALTSYAANSHPLLGINDPEARRVLLAQLIDSIHRVEFPRRLLTRDVSPRRADPTDEEYFDPIRAAVYHSRGGNHDEASWLVSLFVTYGKGQRTGWRIIRDVYDRLGEGGRWDWASASADPTGMAGWIVGHAEQLWPKGTPRPFGAHRRHETVLPTGRTIETYIAWVGDAGHQAKFEAAREANGRDARLTFDALYRDMDSVHRFGRLAKFDYLSMLGKLDLADLEPGSTYMTGATGPVNGARLLFSGDESAAMPSQWLDAQLAHLDAHLGVGMQVLEDALCNWQKSPTRFRPFRG